MKDSVADSRTSIVIERWFSRQGWRPMPYQLETWNSYLNGESGLLHSPTGTGKSLAAWLGPAIEALETGDVSPRATRVLWISPLKALANDLQANLSEAAVGLGLDWQIGIRTGDTSASVRQRMRTRPPAALITTPESLSIMLSMPDAPARFGELRAVVVDEWHELLGSKRGALLELSLARVRAMNPRVRTWGLSATLANLDEALAALLGCGRTGRVIRGAPKPRPEIHSVMPQDIARFPWSGHLGLRLLEDVIANLAAARTTLLFTNTRAQAELWYQAIVNARLDWIDSIALHHGSIARELRTRIERSLRSGQLRCVVCTSSLDLGVDFSPVDQVIQVGSPKGIARLIQRAGRSGHQPDGISRILCVPTNAFELLEVAAARHAVASDQIEARRPVCGALDVLVQHLVTIAAGTGFEKDSMYEEVRSTHAYRELDSAAWQWALDFIVRGGQTLEAYPHYHRVAADGEGRMCVQSASLTRRHRMSIGTITSDATMEIRWLSGGRLGSVEETFIGRLQPGDSFVFSGRVLELVRVRDMTAFVRLARGRSRHVPRWQGGRMPLSTALADAVVALLTTDRDADVHPELETLEPLLELQTRWSALPRHGLLVVERLNSREGQHLYFYPFAGRVANEGLAMLVAHRLTRREKTSVTLTANDYGFELLISAARDLDAADIRELLALHDLHGELLACINASEAAKRQFRDIARISGLVQTGFPGQRKSARQLQASSGLIFDVLERYDAANPLLHQAREEVLNQQLEVERLREVLERIAGFELRIVEIERLTPFAFPLWAERLQSQTLSSEKWLERIERMSRRLEATATRRATRNAQRHA